jgi:hypothetical protein
MPQYVKIIILVSILLIVGLFFITFLFITIKKHKIRNMYLAVDNLLNKIVSANEGYELNKSAEAEYDYQLKTNKTVYYFKVIPNFDSEEITINNSVKWQLRKSFNDESLRFVDGIEPLMRMELPANDNKINKKLYIVYPNARTLLKYINECEMEFVHPDTDVYGTNIITYINLRENRDIIEI